MLPGEPSFGVANIKCFTRVNYCLANKHKVYLEKHPSLFCLGVRGRIKMFYDINASCLNFVDIPSLRSKNVSDKKIHFKLARSRLPSFLIFVRDFRFRLVWLG
jgi:hypothetical protein